MDVSDFRVEASTAVGFLHVGEARIRFDVIDPSYFSGEKTGDEFFRYIEEKWSKKDRIGRVAFPPVVWYTRLFVPSEAYLERISDDLDEGAPVEWLDGALRIARFLGTEGRIRQRLIRLNDIRPVSR
ncbi:MAG: hypothetical protein WB947_00565 [Thermoplasmata archaeon]